VKRISKSVILFENTTQTVIEEKIRTMKRIGVNFLSRFLGVSLSVTLVFLSKTKYIPNPVMIIIFVDPVIRIEGFVFCGSLCRFSNSRSSFIFSNDLRFN